MNTQTYFRTRITNKLKILKYPVRNIIPFRHNTLAVHNLPHQNQQQRYRQIFLRLQGQGPIEQEKCTINKSNQISDCMENIKQYCRLGN